MGYEAQNAVIGKANRLKRAEIPFTINTAAATADVTATIDDEFKGNAEIFVAITDGAAQAPANGGKGGAATSTLDPSATIPTVASSAAPQVGFVVMDGATEKAPANLPQQSDGKNPSYPSTAAQLAAKGNAKKVYSAFAVITNGSDTSMPAGLVGVAARADVAATPNGNLVVRITFTKFFLDAVAAANPAIASTFKVAGQTVKGMLHLAWF